MQTRFSEPAAPFSDRPSDLSAPEARGTGGAAAAPRATARLIRLDPGLFAISIGPISEASIMLGGIVVPAILISAPPSDEFDPVEIVASSGEQGFWLGHEGGAVVVRSPAGGGNVLITTYGTAEQAGAPLEIVIRRLDRAEAEPAVPGEPAPARGREAPVRGREAPAREIPTEVSLHIERVGDRRFPGQGWVGNRGQKLRIEAFSIRPVEVLSPADIEYMAFGPNGRETPWVSEGKLCGTRGRGLPLTGFAVRLAPHLRDRFSVVYQGSFFAGGVAGPAENGNPCASPVIDDPLEAINLRLIDRGQ